MKYSTINPSLQSAHNSSILGTFWERIEASDLKGVKKKVGDNLVDKPKMPTHIFLPAEYNAADMRAELMKSETADLVVTIVVKLPNTLRVESCYYSELDARISELKVLSTGQAAIQLAFCEETGQIFYDHDVKTGIKPRMPDYNFVPVQAHTQGGVIMAVYEFIAGRSGDIRIGMLRPSSGILAYYLKLEYPKMWQRVA